MITFNFKHNKGYKWFSKENIFVKGYAYSSNHEYLEAETLCSYFQSINSKEDFEKALFSLNGLFSIILQKNEVVFAAVDRLRTFPLLYQQINGEFSLSDNFRFFQNNSSEINLQILEDIQSVGYVTGKDTLLNNLYQLQAGEMLVYEKAKIQTSFFYRIPINLQTSLSYDEYKSALRKQILNLGKRINDLTLNKPIALPLSGGYDSRLIAVLLKQNKREDVFCFTYGSKDTKETYLAEKTAKKLGYKWKLIDYEHYQHEDFLHTKIFKDYVDFVTNGISFPYIQEYFAARVLRQEFCLPKETIVIPGHTGDFIGGGHFLPDMKNFHSNNDLAYKIFRTHYQLHPLKKNKQKYLLSQIAKNVDCNLYQNSHLSYDDWESRERQSKQIINSSKVWDFFNYQYILPFWDNDFVDFCMSLPFEMRLFKKLFDEVVEELFAEHQVFFEKEEMNPTIANRKYIYLKKKIKQYLPIMRKLKNNKNSYTPYLRCFVMDMLNDLDEKRYPSTTLVHINWYLKKFLGKI